MSAEQMFRPGVALAARAEVHRALGDEHRLAIVDALYLGDRTPSDLATATGLASNLLAFHLDVLADAGLVTRRVSEGDRRRRYVRLHPEVLSAAAPQSIVRAEDVLFVCTANSARSQLAAALWERETGRTARSAGREPAERVAAEAIDVAATHGLDLHGRRPAGYGALVGTPDLVVTVCDRAREEGLPFPTATLHWSVPDPVRLGIEAVERAFVELESRVRWLARASSS